MIASLYQRSSIAVMLLCKNRALMALHAHGCRWVASRGFPSSLRRPARGCPSTSQPEAAQDEETERRIEGLAVRVAGASVVGGITAWIGVGFDDRRGRPDRGRARGGGGLRSRGGARLRGGGPLGATRTRVARFRVAGVFAFATARAITARVRRRVLARAPSGAASRPLAGRAVFIATFVARGLSARLFHVAIDEAHAFAHGDPLVGAHVVDGVDGAARPRDGDGDPAVASEADVHGKEALRQQVVRSALVAIAVSGRAVDVDLGTEAVDFARHALELDREPAPAHALVAVEEVGRELGLAFAVGHGEVEESVAVVVDERGTHAG